MEPSGGQAFAGVERVLALPVPSVTEGEAARVQVLSLSPSGQERMSREHAGTPHWGLVTDNCSAVLRPAP